MIESLKTVKLKYKYKIKIYIKLTDCIKIIEYNYYKRYKKRKVF